MIRCKTCGHTGSKENPLCRQGVYTIPYCRDCMNKACKKAGNDSVVRKIKESGPLLGIR